VLLDVSEKQSDANGEFGGCSSKNFKDVNITVSLIFWCFYLKKLTFLGILTLIL
jgi:hypothetical protein